MFISCIGCLACHAFHSTATRGRAELNGNIMRCRKRHTLPTHRIVENSGLTSAEPDEIS